MKRGTGVTSSQINSAPINAVYVWCNDSLAYPKALAKSLHRSDVEIVGATDADLKLRGSHHKVILDHASTDSIVRLRGLMGF